MLPQKRRVTERNSKSNKRSTKTIKQKQGQSAKRCVDLIAQCPYEILVSVFNRLDTMTICQCLIVSTTWHHRILHSPDIWRKIDFNIAYSITKERVPSRFPPVSQHVEEIALTTDRKVIARYLESFQEDMFPKLRSLTLDYRSSVEGDKAKITTPFYSALRAVGKTLKELHLRTRYNDHNPLLPRRILAHCPNLTTLSLRVPEIKDDVKRPPKPHHSLISAELYPESRAHAILQQFFRSVPNIRHLVIEVPLSQLLDLLPDILQHCPRLRMLSNQRRAFPRVKDNILQSLADDDDESQGLQYILLDSLNSVRHIVPLLRKCCSTLKGISLAGQLPDLRRIVAEQQLLLSSLIMPNLTDLRINFTTSNTLWMQIAPLIRNHPRLTTIHLDYQDKRNSFQNILASTTNDIFSALMELKYLSSLALSGFDVHNQPLEQLLKHCAKLECFTALSIVHIRGLSPAALHIAASIQRLEVLQLGRAFYSWISADDVDEMARLIGQLPRLKRLQINGWKLSDKAVRSIISSKSLHLLLHCYNELSSDAEKLLKPITVSLSDKLDDQLKWVKHVAIN